MDLQGAKNKLRQLFTDHRYAMMENNSDKANALGNEYKIIRSFCIEFDIITFKDMERLEFECNERIDRLEKQSLKDNQ